MIAKRAADKKKRPDVRDLGKEENPCVWMSAGVVNLKLCHRAYDCLNCPFDEAMTGAWGQGLERGRGKPSRDGV